MGVHGAAPSSFSRSDRERFLDVRGGVWGVCALAEMGWRIFLDDFLTFNVGFEDSSIGLASDGGATFDALVAEDDCVILFVRRDCSA